MTNSHYDTNPIGLVSSENIGALISDLTKKYVNIWWDCPLELPPSRRLYSTDEQTEIELLTKEILSSLYGEIRRSGGLDQDFTDFVKYFTPVLKQYLQQLLDLDDRQIDTLDELGFIDLGLSFLRNVIQFDAEIDKGYILQALPNIWVMNLVQLILQKSILLTDAMTAYSLLYPYTDNLLDDPGIRDDEKQIYNERLEQTLNGRNLSASNVHERAVFSLIECVLGSYDRDHEKLVRAGLLAIHRAQKRSLDVQNGVRSENGSNTLGISIEKGGVSVVVNGCLVSETVNYKQADLLFGYGSFLQFQDDLLDIGSDADAGIKTIFSQPSSNINLDDQALRLFQYRKRIFEGDGFMGCSIPSVVRSIMQRTAELIPVGAVALAPERFSQEFLHSLEGRFPVRFDYLRQERNRFKKVLPKIKTRLNDYSTQELIQHAEKTSVS